jgi:hypothetical protein
MDNLSAAINRAIAELAALRDDVRPPLVSTMQRQVASALNHCDYAERIVEITGDLRVAVAQEVANLGEQLLSDGDRRALRTDDIITDLVTDARSWCDEARAEQREWANA